MYGVRFPALAALSPAALACLVLSGCSGLMTRVGGGMTPELERSGVAAPAEIVEVWDTGWTINDSPVIGMKVRVRPADRPEFEATIEKTTISRIAVPQFQPGNLIPVRFDPQNPASIAVDPDGDPTAESTPSSGNPYRDRFERAEIVVVPDWAAELEDTTNVVGVHVEWQAPRGLELGADYALATSEGAVSLLAAAGDSGFPLLLTRWHDARVFARYPLRPGLALRLDLLREIYEADDWSRVDADAVGNLLALGQGAQSGSVTAAVLTLRWQFPAP